MNIVHLLVDRFARGGVQASPTGHVERAGTGAVDFVEVVDQTNPVIVGGLENYGAGTVAKDHAGGSVGVVDDRRHHVRADDHDLLMHAGRNVLCASLQSEEESGTGGGEIESPGAFRT